jgi:Fe2+ transport system protein B
MAGSDGNGEEILRGRVPVPDPTVLTTLQLQREIGLSRELVELKVSSVREVLSTRMDGVDTAIKLLEDRIQKIVERANHEIARLQEFHNEKFAGVELRFNEHDKRTEQLASADKTAVAAALQAQKESVNAQNISNAAAAAKAETTFTKQIEQLQAIVNTITKSMEDKISDLKSRVDTIEAKKAGGNENWSAILGGTGVVVSLITLAILLFSHRVV